MTPQPSEADIALARKTLLHLYSEAAPRETMVWAEHFAAVRAEAAAAGAEWGRVAEELYQAVADYITEEDEDRAKEFDAMVVAMNHCDKVRQAIRARGEAKP